MEALLCSIPDAAKALGLGRSKIYELAAEGGASGNRYHWAASARARG